jgi:hypothetical protein
LSRVYSIKVTAATATTTTAAATRQEQQHQTVTHFTNTKANTAVTLPLTGFGFIK